MDLTINNLLIKQEAPPNKQGVDFTHNYENKGLNDKQDQLGNVKHVEGCDRSQYGSGFPDGGNELPREVTKSERFQVFLDASINGEKPISEDIASLVKTNSDETDSEAVLFNPFITFANFEDKQSDQSVASQSPVLPENVNSVSSVVNVQNETIKNTPQISLNHNLLKEQAFSEYQMDPMKGLETQTSEIYDEFRKNQTNIIEDGAGEYTLPFELKQEKAQRAYDLNEQFTLLNNDESKHIDIQNFSNMVSNSHKDSTSENEQSIDALARINGLMVKSEFLIKEFSPSQDISAKYVAIESFNDEIADQINLMVNTNENSAKINVVPPELGQIEINIHQHNDKTHISFITNIEQTKDIISMNIESLKIQLHQSGLLMGDVWVGHQKDQGEGQAHKSPNNLKYSNDSENHVKETSYRLSRVTNSLDLYA